LPKELTPAERQALKGRAHGLKPVVLVGEAGLTPAVVREIERALATHELIKIRVMGTARDSRDALLSEVCAATGSAPVQHIGKVLVVYREKPPEVAEKAPARERRRPARAKPSGPRRTPRRAKIRSR
jgi:putative YhbY family RNA-binding protein